MGKKSLPDGLKTFLDPPADDLIADADYWDHARWQLRRTIPTLEYEEASEFFSGGLGSLPILGWIKKSLSERLKAANKTFDLDRPDMEAAHLALESMNKIETQLVKNGIADLEAIKVCLLTVDMVVNVLRSGLLPELIEMGKSHSDSQSKKAKKPRTRGGLTPEDRAERNKKIIEAFKKSALTEKHWADKHAKKYELSSSMIRKILRKTR